MIMSTSSDYSNRQRVFIMKVKEIQENMNRIHLFLKRKKELIDIFLSQYFWTIPIYCANNLYKYMSLIK